MNNMFDETVKAVPLAERLRPQTIEDFVGQPALLSLDDASLKTGSLILWGPPGTGKTVTSATIVYHFLVVLLLS